MSSPLSPGADRPRPAPARPDAVVMADGARFTVLTDRLIRMELSPTGYVRYAETDAGKIKY